MASNFPSSLDSFTNPSSSDALDSVSVPHASQHSDLNDAVEALQAKVGADSSGVASSHDYKIAQLEARNTAGLVLISRTTIGSAVSSVTVSDAFSADYDTYKIILSGGAGSTISNLTVQMGSTTTGYYGGLIYEVFSTAAVGGVGQVNAASWAYAGQGGSLGLTMNATIMQPYLEKATSIMSLQPRLTTTAGAGTNSSFSGFLDDATSYTSFTLGADAGTLTGGTIDVYGYAKA